MQPQIELGTVLQNRYRLLSILGQGGFGRTYLAEDQGRFNELCAIKELIPPQSGNYALEKSKELFQREAQVLYQIQHLQIPQFRATFEQDGRFFIVQDYVDGQTCRALLDQRLTQGYVFPETEVTQLLQQTLPMLSYLHGKGIIHRDIAPDNIILRDRDRLPVLIDFGVVKELATRIQTPGTPPATTVGKVGYAPMEQMQTGRAYPNSDLYALAVTVITLLTGREPQELLDDKTMTWHWQRWAVVSPGLAQILNRMLSHIPSDRYQSAAEVQQALQALTQPQPQPPPSPATPATSVAPGSQMATVAVGHALAAPEPYSPPPAESRRQPPAIPRESSLWDDPVAVIAIGIGLIILAGVGSWLVFRAIMGTQTPEQPSPAPTLTPRLTPTPSPSLSPSPTPSITSFSQAIDLRPDQPVTRSAPLSAGQTLNLTFAATQGDLLDVVLSGEGVLMTVLGPNNQPVDDRAKRVSLWQGELPFTGTYTLQLSPVQGLEKGEFKLDAKLKTPVVETPTPTPTPPPTASPSPTNNPRPPEIKTERILIPSGQTQVAIQGQATANLARRYLLQAKQGQTLQVRLTDNARLELRYPNGQPVEDASGITQWSGQLPDSGDYLIDVTAPNTTDFQLNVTLE
jgi:serine/threonine-protein kinase